MLLGVCVAAMNQQLLFSFNDEFVALPPVYWLFYVLFLLDRHLISLLSEAAVAVSPSAAVRMFLFPVNLWD